MAVSTIERPFPINVIKPFVYVRSNNGATEVITTTGGTRAILFITDSNANNCGALCVFSNTANAVGYTKIGGLSGVTITGNNSSVTITHSNSSPVYSGYVTNGSISITAS